MVATPSRCGARWGCRSSVSTGRRAPSRWRAPPSRRGLASSTATPASPTRASPAPASPAREWRGGRRSALRRRVLLERLPVARAGRARRIACGGARAPRAGWLLLSQHALDGRSRSTPARAARCRASPVRSWSGRTCTSVAARGARARLRLSPLLERLDEIAYLEERPRGAAHDHGAGWWSAGRGGSRAGRCGRPASPEITAPACTVSRSGSTGRAHRWRPVRTR